jgi:hypothetical protein
MESLTQEWILCTKEGVRYVSSGVPKKWSTRKAAKNACYQARKHAVVLLSGGGPTVCISRLHGRGLHDLLVARVKITE